MLNLKHTPGLWRVEYDEVDSISSVNGTYIATIESCHADAKLMVNAPEMLETLIELYERIKKAEKISIPKISALIERATGLPIEEIIQK